MKTRHIIGYALLATSLLFATWGASHQDGRLIVAALAFCGGLVMLEIFEKNVGTYDEWYADVTARADILRAEQEAVEAGTIYTDDTLAMPIRVNARD